MDPKDQIEFLERVIGFIKIGNGELALKTLDFARREFTVMVLSGIDNSGLSIKEKQLVAAGNPIKAIKALRDRTRCSLAGARDVVEAYCKQIGAEFLHGMSR